MRTVILSWIEDKQGKQEKKEEIVGISSIRKMAATDQSRNPHSSTFLRFSRKYHLLMKVRWWSLFSVRKKSQTKRTYLTYGWESGQKVIIALWEVRRDLCYTLVIKDFESKVMTPKTRCRNMGFKSGPRSAVHFKQMLGVKP